MEGSFPSKCNFSTFTSIFIRGNEFCRMVLVSTMTVVTLVTYWKKMRSLKVEETFNVHLEIGQIMSRFYNVELWLELNWSPIQTECKDIVNGSDIPNYERQSTPVFTVDIIAIFSTVFILMYFVLLLLNKDKPVVSKMGKIYHGGHLKISMKLQDCITFPSCLEGPCCVRSLACCSSTPHWAPRPACSSSSSAASGRRSCSPRSSWRRGRFTRSLQSLSWTAATHDWTLELWWPSTSVPAWRTGLNSSSKNTLRAASSSWCQSSSSSSSSSWLPGRAFILKGDYYIITTNIIINNI